MSNLKKILSVLLAVVMVFSITSIGVEASYSAYKDAGITNGLGYDVIDKPILSVEQYASMACDEVDRMLGEANIKINENVGGLLDIKLNATSIDSALDDVGTLWSSVEGLISSMGDKLGDLKNLDMSALIGNGAPRRRSTDKTDLDLLLSLFDFLDDNKTVLAKLPYGNTSQGINLGVIGNFVDISEYLDIGKLVKDMVAKFVYPIESKDKSFDSTQYTLDQYFNTFITMVFDGTYPKKQYEYIDDLVNYIKAYAPNIGQHVDFLQDSVYEIIDKLIREVLGSQAAINKFVNNPQMGIKKLLWKLCGAEYTKIKNAEPYADIQYTIDLSELNVCKDVFNMDYQVSAIDMSSWGAAGTDLAINHLNEIAGQIVNAIIDTTKVTINWSNENGNDDLLNNIIATAKAILTATGGEFFASYIEVKPPETFNTMTNQQFVAYITRSVCNASIDGVFIPNTCDTVVKVVFELVKQLMVYQIPERDYSNLTPSLDNIIKILCDFAVYGLKMSTNMNVSYDMSVNELANTAFNWLKTNYGGLISDSATIGTGWSALSSLFFKIIPSNWLPKKDGSARTNVYSILYDDILTNVADLNLTGILDLLQKNPSTDASSLNSTLVKVISNRITSIVNYIIPGSFSTTTLSSLEALIGPAFLSSFISGFIGGLNARISTMAKPILQIVCSALGLTDPESFDYPFINLGDTFDATAALSFYMYNGSSGLNTNFTDKNGNKTQDKLYTYNIKNVKATATAVNFGSWSGEDTMTTTNINVTPTTGTINGGTSKTFTLSSRPAAGSILKVDITYEVLEESGGTMTPQPLVATTYSYVLASGEVDDGSEATKIDTDVDNVQCLYVERGKYYNQNGTLGDLTGVEFKLQRDASGGVDHQENSTMTLNTTASSIDPALAAAGIQLNAMSTFNSTPNGAQTTYMPYKLAAGANKDTKIPVPDEGVYVNDFQFDASYTMNDDETLSFSQYIYVYTNYGLNGMVNSALSSNRQKANYDQGSYKASYVDFYDWWDYQCLTDEEKEEQKFEDLDKIPEETVSGSAAWTEYENALRYASYIVNKPRSINTFPDFADRYQAAAERLYIAIQRLEAGSVSSGAAGLKEDYDAVVPPNVRIEEVVPENEGDPTTKEVDLEYYEPGYEFFGMSDYVPYTYNNFRRAKNAASNLIDKWEDGKDVDAIDVAYRQHRFNLYASRLIRVQAVKTHLDRELAISNQITAVGAHYDSEVWDNFVTARAFAYATSQKDLGTVIAGTNYLVGTPGEEVGLRQSQVNTALEELIYARKRLVESVDYAQLKAAIEQTKDTYNEGNDAPTYEETSWDEFANAYKNAVKLVDQALSWSEENQLLVNNAAEDLLDAFRHLESAEEPGIVPVEGAVESNLEYVDGSASTVIFYDSYNVDDNGDEVIFLIGLDKYNLDVDSTIQTTGGAHYIVDYTNNENYLNSTGAKVIVYTGEEVDDASLIDDGEHTIIAVYHIVMFGDINGDASIGDAGDFAEVLSCYDAFWAENGIADNPWFFAADVNHDGSVDSGDFPVFIDTANGDSECNQAWTMEGDEYEIFM